MSKITRLRFNCADDLNILRCVLIEKPFENPSRWHKIHKKIVENNEKKFSLRAIKEHVDYLLKSFTKEGRIKLQKSGTEEQIEEKQYLLQEMVDLKQKSTSSSSNPIRVKCLELRDAAAAANEYSENAQDNGELMEENSTSVGEICNTAIEEIDMQNLPSTSSTPTSFVSNATKTGKKRKYDEIKNEAFQFIKDRQNIESELKQKQLELDERKMSLEERKMLIEERKMLIEERKMSLQEENFNLQKHERTQRIEMDMKERLSYMKNMEQQQQLISLVLNILKDDKKNS